MGNTGKSSWFKAVTLQVVQGAATQRLRVQLPIRCTVKDIDGPAVLVAVSDIAGAFKTRPVVCLIVVYGYRP